MGKRKLKTLSPLAVDSLLAGNPVSQAKYHIAVKNCKGCEVFLADPRATRALLLLMNQHAVIGGAACHWGGPSAFAEIMSSLYALMFEKNPWYSSFNFVNDAGHTENGLYALQANYGFAGLTLPCLKKFRGIDSRLTGHGEAHVNPQGVMISNGPLGSGISQAQGLALADKIAGNKRITICTISDGGCMEGEAKEALASIVGLTAKGFMNPFVLVISDNNTKLSGRIDEDAFSMESSFKSLDSLGWRRVLVEEGNDLQKVYQILEKTLNEVEKEPGMPIAIHCKTIKGFGIKETMESSSGGHGYPLRPYDKKLKDFIAELYQGDIPGEFESWVQEILQGKPKSSSQAKKDEKVQAGFDRALKWAADEFPVFSISADLQGSTGVKGFHERFPDRWVEMGVAESNMISTAVGLSKQGYIPIVDTFSQFGITKGNLPLIMAGLSNAPVIALFSHTGFQDAADGASHQSTTYFAATCALPKTTIICCSCSSEAEAFMKEAVTRMAKEKEKGNDSDSIIFFMGRENHPPSFMEDPSYRWQKAQILRTGKDCTLVSCGPMTGQALEAASQLEKEGISLTVINNPFIDKPDIETIGKELKKTKGNLITMEDHQIIGGMGAQLIHRLILSGYDFKAQTLGIKNTFGRSAYQASHLYDLHELNTKGVHKAWKRLKDFSR